MLAIAKYCADYYADQWLPAVESPMTYILGCHLRALAPDLPIVIITGNASEDQRELDRVSDGPPVAVLANPFTMDLLIRTLKTVTR